MFEIMLYLFASTYLINPGIVHEIFKHSIKLYLYMIGFCMINKGTEGIYYCIKLVVFYFY